MAELAQNQSPVSREQFSRVNQVRVREREYTQSNRRRGRRAADRGRKATGLALQATGKATTASGKALARGGAALSSTGVGAVVGVPMAAVGGAMVAGGRVVDRSGRLVRKSGQVVADDEKVGLFSKMVLSAIGWFMITWLWIFQLVLTFVLIYGFTFLMGVSTEEPTGAAAGADPGFFERMYNSVAASVSEFAAQQIAVPSILMAWGICMLLCWFVLFVSLFSILMMRWSGSSNVKPLNTATKEMLFMAAVVGYALPLVQAVPWGFFWIRHLRRHGADSE